MEHEAQAERRRVARAASVDRQRRIEESRRLVAQAVEIRRKAGRDAAALRKRELMEQRRL